MGRPQHNIKPTPRIRRRTAPWVSPIHRSCHKTPACKPGRRPTQRPKTLPGRIRADRQEAKERPLPQDCGSHRLRSPLMRKCNWLACWRLGNSEAAGFDRFHCTFFKFQYDRFFNQSTPGTAEAPITDKGEIYYAAPDKGVFKVEPPQEKKEKSAPSREQKWICDGKAVYEYDFDNHEIRKYVIPPEQQGEGIREGPLPFIFGAKAARLSARYWIRINTPADAKGQIWLEVYPKYQQDAANFFRIDLILSAENLQPFALQIHDSTRQSRTVYQFQQITVNGNRLGEFLKFNDPFRVDVPRDWKIVSGDVPRVQGPPPAAPGRRSWAVASLCMTPVASSSAARGQAHFSASARGHNATMKRAEK